MRRGRRVDQPTNEWLAERCKFGLCLQRNNMRMREEEERALLLRFGSHL